MSEWFDVHHAWRAFPTASTSLLAQQRKRTHEKSTPITPKTRTFDKGHRCYVSCRLCLNWCILIVRHCRHCPTPQSATEQSPISPWVNFKTDWLRLPFLDSSTDWDPNPYHPTMYDINDIHAAGTSTYMLIRQHPGWLLMNNMDPSQSTSRYFWTPLIRLFCWTQLSSQSLPTRLLPDTQDGDMISLPSLPLWLAATCSS